MCDNTANELYEDQWNDYFTYVNSDVRQKFKWEDDLYIAYGSHNDLPISEIGFWYGDAEDLFVSAAGTESYITFKYGHSIINEEDVEYFTQMEIDENMLYENMGYWFSA